MGTLTQTGSTVVPTRGIRLLALTITREHVLLFGVLVVAAVIRTTWTIATAPPPESDFLTFLETARAIGAGEWRPDSYGWAWQGPGYPLLIAPLTLLGSLLLPAIYTANVALGVVTVWLLFRVGTVLFDSRCGLVAAAIGALYPGLWLWTPIVSAENLSVPLLLTITLLLLTRTPTWRLPLVGVLTYALVFVRPSMLFYVVVVLITAIALAPASQKRLAAGLVAIAFVVLIWVTSSANQAAGGSGLPVGASGWQAWLVHNERATGSWFPAQDRSDYPFHGMENNPEVADIVRGAQFKLALQFALLNPTEILPGIIDRHIGSWRRDDAGLDWTVRRPNSGPLEASISSALDGVVASSFAVVLWLSLFGLWIRGGRIEVALALVLPIAYVAAPAAIAEGNARYHVNAMPFAILLSAAALAGTTRRQLMIAVIGSLGVAAWGAQPTVLTPTLVAAIVAVGVARLILELIRTVRATVRTSGGRRRVVWAFAGVVIAAELFVAVAFASARQAVLDWSISQPDQWVVYRGSEVTDTAKPAVRRSDIPSSMRRVSFQDAAALPSELTAGSDRVGLARTFPNLNLGDRYVIYLQISDPPDSVRDRVSVLANGEAVWELPQDERPATGWHDVVVPLVADSPFLHLQVERVAKSPGGSDLLVRNVHLYPRY